MSFEDRTNTEPGAHEALSSIDELPKTRLNEKEIEAKNQMQPLFYRYLFTVRGNDVAKIAKWTEDSPHSLSADFNAFLETQRGHELLKKYMTLPEGDDDALQQFFAEFADDFCPLHNKECDREHNEEGKC